MKYTMLLLLTMLLLEARQPHAQLSSKRIKKLSEYFANQHKQRLQALEEGNYKAYQDCFAKESYLFDIGVTLQGKKAIAKHAENIIKSMHIKNTQNVQKEVEVSGNLAYDYGTTSMDLHYIFTDEVESVKSKYIAIWKKNTTGQWKIIKLIFNQEG